jgi:hypothetical protein
MQKYMPSWVKCNHQTIMAHEVAGKLRTFFNKMASYQRAGKITPEAPIVLVSYLFLNIFLLSYLLNYVLRFKKRKKAPKSYRGVKRGEKQKKPEFSKIILPKIAK